VNRLLGQDRLVVAAEPGTTRDAIDTPFEYQGRKLVFIDTAGSPQAQQSARGPRVLFDAAHHARDGARDVCLLVVDAKDGMHVQDLKMPTMRGSAAPPSSSS